MSKRLDEISARVEDIHTEALFMIGYSNLLIEKGKKAILKEDWAEFNDLMRKRNKIRERTQELGEELKELKQEADVLRRGA